MRSNGRAAAANSHPVSAWRLLGSLWIARAVFGVFFLFALILRPIVATAQVASSPDQSGNAGEDFFRPPSNLFQMMEQYRTAPGSGSTKGSLRDVTTEALNLRLDHALDLAPMWILALRSDLPLLAKNPISSSNPDGDYLHGVGDADVQAAVIHNLRFIARTATQRIGDPSVAVASAPPDQMMQCVC